MENMHEREDNFSNSGRDKEPDSAGCCPPGSPVDCCSAPGDSKSSRKSWGKTVIFVTVILAALAVGGYSLLRKSDAGILDPGQQASSCGSGGGASCGMALRPPQSIARLADGKEAVFILLSGNSEKRDKPAIGQVETIVNSLASRGKRVAAFPLGKYWEGYDELVKQYSVNTFPCVLVFGRSNNAVKVSGDITTETLLKAYMQASTPAKSCGVRCDPSACGR